jgi:hypothetical protein
VIVERDQPVRRKRVPDELTKLAVGWMIIHWLTSMDAETASTLPLRRPGRGM